MFSYVVKIIEKTIIFIKTKYFTFGGLLDTIQTMKGEFFILAYINPFVQKYEKGHRMKSINTISPSVIKRMPKYLRILRDLEQDGEARGSSAQIAELLGTTASQVRQDLSAFGSYGFQGYGYNIPCLSTEIEKILGINHKHTIAVIGVGSIGKALIEHLEFERYNYRVCGAFDVNPDVIGTVVNGVCNRVLYR